MPWTEITSKDAYAGRLLLLHFQQKTRQGTQKQRIFTLAELHEILRKEKKNVRQEKGTQTQTFSSGYLGEVEVFQVKGWGPKDSVCPSKPKETNFLVGYPGIFAGISRRCPEKLENNKRLCSILGT